MTTFFSRRLAMTLGAASLLISGLAIAGPAGASAHAAGGGGKDPLCTISVTSPVVEMGFLTTESSFAAVIQVECEPGYSQQTVTIDATELAHACGGNISWAEPPATPTANQPQFTVYVDNDGNTTAVVWGGPSCAPGTYHIFASLNAPPFPTVSTTITLLPPGNTPHGVKAAPKSIVEDATYSSVATVVSVEFPAYQSEKQVTIKSDELSARCAGSVIYYGAEEQAIGAGHEATVTLDNNGNAFAVIIAGPSCAAGTSTIVASLVTVPYTTFSTTFTILSPRPTNP